MLIQKDTGPAITSNRWQDYDNLVSFVAATASESSPIELKQVRSNMPVMTKAKLY